MAYSRRTKIEERRNIRKAYFLIFLTVAVMAAFFFFGLPAVVKFAAVLTDLRQSGTGYEASDTTPPTPPRINALPLATNDKEIEITGDAEPGATVRLFVNDEAVEVLANNEGDFFQKVTLIGGANTISALVIDSSQNESAPSEEYSVIYDVNPPDLEITKPEDGSSFFGSQQRQLVIEGVTEENASVNINGRIVIVASDGKFSFATTLSEGENNFTVTARDAAENDTEKSFSVSYAP